MFSCLSKMNIMKNFYIVFSTTFKTKIWNFCSGNLKRMLPKKAILIIVEGLPAWELKTYITFFSGVSAKKKEIIGLNY